MKYFFAFTILTIIAYMLRCVPLACWWKSNSAIIRLIVPLPPARPFPLSSTEERGKREKWGGGGQEGGDLRGPAYRRGPPPHAGRITLLIPKFYQLIIKKDDFNNSVAFVGIGYSNFGVLNFLIQQRFLYSLKLSQLPDSPLQLKKQSNTAPVEYWVTEFVDGEGSFILLITENKNFKVGWEVKLCFAITLHKSD